MSRVITFSRTFPLYHPRSGEQTHFIEKLYMNQFIGYEFKAPIQTILNLDLTVKYEPKYHTIRAGKRWKIGDKFSPRVWSGKPYRSKQLILAPDIAIKKVYDIRICPTEIDGKVEFVGAILINERLYFDWLTLACNDGLELQEMLDWFKPSLPFKGQIICWNETIKY
jgi:hypothetical protein